MKALLLYPDEVLLIARLLVELDDRLSASLGCAELESERRSECELKNKSLRALEILLSSRENSPPAMV